MNYRLLGPSGLRVSELCLGAMTFGEEWGWGAPAETAAAIYAAFREQGGNFVDTADVYTGGTSERILADLIAPHRQEMVLATKFTAVTGAGPNAAGNHRKKIVESVEASLRRLKTDYIDLYWVHAWDQITPVEETMRALDDLVRQGKVLYLGSSDTPSWITAEANTLAELRGWTAFAAIQVEYSLLERTVERDLIPMARHRGLSVLAWSPLANGLLTGKYLKARAEGEAARLDAPGLAPDWTLHRQRAEAVALVVQAVATECGRSCAQVALAWLRHRNAIAIVGATKLAQLQDNIESLTLTLTPDQLATLHAASAVDMGFPQTFLNRDLLRFFIYGGFRERIQTERFVF